MKKNELYIYIPLSFALLLPVPGRFAYGLIIVFLLYLMSVCGILFKKFAVKFFNAELSNVIVTIMLVSLCILVRQLVIVFSPLIAFVLGIAFFNVSIFVLSGESLERYRRLFKTSSSIFL